MTRINLPNRRPNQTREIEFGNRRFIVTAGFQELPGDNAALREVFIKGAAREGEDLLNIVEDVAVVISVALQHGVPIAALAKSMARLPEAVLAPVDLDRPAAGDRAPASVIGAILDLLVKMQADNVRTF